MAKLEIVTKTGEVLGVLDDEKGTTEISEAWRKRKKKPVDPTEEELISPEGKEE